jgi:hypothetical protein
VVLDGEEDEAVRVLLQEDLLRLARGGLALGLRARQVVEDGDAGDGHGDAEVLLVGGGEVEGLLRGRVAHLEGRHAVDGLPTGSVSIVTRLEADARLSGGRTVLEGVSWVAVAIGECAEKVGRERRWQTEDKLDIGVLESKG